MIPVITIDGPSGSGKGTLSRRLAKILGWNLLDSGIIYRILASIALNKRVNIHEEDKLLEILHGNMQVNFVKNKNRFITFLNNIECENTIYTELIGKVASEIAVYPKIRSVLLTYQRSFCVSPGLIADGRDMGTVVFPNAIVKIFLYSSIHVRKQRRLEQLQKLNFNANLKCLLSQIQERDERDYNRKIAPLIPAVDALILDSTYLSKMEVENKALTYIQNSFCK